MNHGIVTDKFLQTILQYEYLKNRDGRLRDARINISQFFLSPEILPELRPDDPREGSRDNTPPPSPEPSEVGSDQENAGFFADGFEDDAQLPAVGPPGRRSNETSHSSTDTDQTGSSYAVNEEQLDAAIEANELVDYPRNGLNYYLNICRRRDDRREIMNYEVMVISWHEMRWWFRSFARNEVPDEPVRRSRRTYYRLRTVGMMYAAPRYSKLTRTQKVEFDYNKLKITTKVRAIQFEWEHLSNPDVEKKVVEYWIDVPKGVPMDESSTLQWIGDDVRLWKEMPQHFMALNEFKSMARFLTRCDIVLEQLDFDLEPYSKWNPKAWNPMFEYLNYYTVLVHEYMLDNEQHWLPAREFYMTMYRQKIGAYQPFDLRWLKIQHLEKIGYRTWNDLHDEERDIRNWYYFHRFEVTTNSWRTARTLSLDSFYRDVTIPTMSKFTSLQCMDITPEVVMSILDDKVKYQDQNRTTVYLPYLINFDGYKDLFGPYIDRKLEYTKQIRIQHENDELAFTGVVNFETPRQILIYIELIKRRLPKNNFFTSPDFFSPDFSLKS